MGISDGSSDVCSSDRRAWFFFTAPVGAIIVQNLCLATSVYLDTRADPVFPRWVAHFNIAIAALMIPSAFSLLCKTGPLAWDGSLSFTLRLGTYAVYVPVMFLVLLRVGSRQHEDAELIAGALRLQRRPLPPPPDRRGARTQTPNRGP